MGVAVLMFPKTQNGNCIIHGEEWIQYALDSGGLMKSMLA